MSQKKKIAVVLLNLGGPCSKESIKPFLFNFFMDKNIIRLPKPLRFLVAKLISIRRTKREAGESYGELGDKSPLLENSEAQGQILENSLNENSSDYEFKNFICMRYWHPMSDKVAQKVKEYAPDQVIILPLYPQFSTTTTRSSLQVWDKAMKDLECSIPTATICCYPWDEGFISASADNIKKIYEKAKKETKKKPRILFSAHGLPESIIKEGDPYQWQCEQTAEKIAEQVIKITGENILDWQICYQSRVGPQKWIGPSTEDALEEAANDNVPVVILPHAFTQEHVETLVEIEIEYREEAEKMGLHDFYRVPTVGTHPDFIKGMADMVMARLDTTGIESDQREPLCPSGSKDCCMKNAASYSF
ncbi:MAG: ferrochelatase [Pseudomonadota bacterium]